MGGQHIARNFHPCKGHHEPSPVPHLWQAALSQREEKHQRPYTSQSPSVTCAQCRDHGSCLPKLRGHMAYTHTHTQEKHWVRKHKGTGSVREQERCQKGMAWGGTVVCKSFKRKGMWPVSISQVFSCSSLQKSGRADMIADVM